LFEGVEYVLEEFEISKIDYEFWIHDPNKKLIHLVLSITIFSKFPTLLLESHLTTHPSPTKFNILKLHGLWYS